jgi:hypothetical protein
MAGEPGRVSAGPFEITPKLGFETRFDDNIFNSPEDEESDTIFVVNPNLEAVAGDEVWEFSLELDLVDGTYQDSGDDDFTDWRINTDVTWDLNRRSTFDLFAGYHELHEYRGTGFSEGEVALLIDEPDEYDETLFGGHYTFGSDSSRGRIKVGGDYYEKDYTNNQPQSDTRDRDDTTMDAAFFWRVAPKTEMLAEVRYTEIEYQNPFTDGRPQLDSDETRYLLGVTWKATGKTSGTVKLGILDKDFDDSNREDFDGEFTWDVSVTWRPREQHIIEVGVAQLANETTGQGDFINIEQYSASWAFMINSRLQLFAHGRYSNDEYEGSDREDDLLYGEFGVEYGFRRWLELRASYSYQERDSETNVRNDLDFSKNLFLIGVEISL